MAWNDLLESMGVETLEHLARNIFHAFFMSSGKAMTNTDNVHIGQLVKSVFDESGMTVSELARQLHCERTNVYTIFKRRTVDVELLAMLSEILNHNFLDDAMRLYGLSATFSPKLNLSINLDDFTSEKMEHLAEMIALSRMCDYYSQET